MFSSADMYGHHDNLKITTERLWSMIVLFYFIQ